MLILLAALLMQGIEIRTLSTRPTHVTGGDVLVEVFGPEGTSVELNGRDITTAFSSTGASMRGLVTGLRPGPNTLRAAHDLGASQLDIVNHPVSGPVFSGPQEKPFICQTAEFKLPDGTSLGAPVDESCSAKTTITYLYQSRLTRRLVPLADPTAVPEDVEMTTTTDGKTVPWVVRVETGTVNRAIYQIAMLNTPDAWNKRLVYHFGGGCMGGWFKQGVKLGGPASLAADWVVAKGYATASATLNVFGNNCNDVLAAETMMMVKEHFIETVGVPAFTIGRGGSGGAYQQVQIAQNYPGLLDGIIPGATFPDVLATIQFLTDIQLLNRYFQTSTLTEAQQLAIAGVGTIATVRSVGVGADRIKGRGQCPPELSATLLYDPLQNPSGTRCNVFDHTVNVYGRDPKTGWARRPIDNTGVQYGLAALNSGAITVDQFLDLNERIGGHDDDGEMVPARSIADAAAVRAAYETGRVAQGRGGLASIPILEMRAYLDLKPKGDLHLKYHSFGFRERLRKANGTAANHIMVVTGEKEPAGHEGWIVRSMDQWLTTGNKPVDLVDACFGADGERIVEPQTFSGGRCNALYPTFPSPRMVAGGPVTNDVLKCTLKPVDIADYQATFTPEQQDRLRRVFATGVCDWTAPGVEQRPLAGTWLTF